MKVNTIIFLLVILGLASLLFISWRRRVKEREEMDEEYRQNLLRKNKTQPTREEEEDYMLKLRAGKKPDQRQDARQPE